MFSYSILLFIFFIFVPGNCVFYPPSFVYQPVKEAVYMKGEALLLRCLATGNPSPLYTWRKNNKDFDYSINVGRYTRWPNEGTLIFAYPGDDDDGIYQCIAKNDRGVALSNKVNIRRAEFQQFTNKDPRAITVTEGNPVKLQCQAPISYPPPIIAWKKSKNGMTELLKDSSKYVVDFDGNLFITGVTVDEDDGASFTCTAFNDRMRVSNEDKAYMVTVTPSQAKVGVKLLYRTLQPIVTSVGQKLIIRCILGGNPPPTYRWAIKGSKEVIMQRPNLNQEAGGAMLVINPVVKTDADIYECTGENAISPKPIINQFLVKVQMAPILTVKLVDQNVPINGSCKFTCEAEGDPTPQIDWTVNGLDLNTYLNGENKKKIGNTIYLTQLTPTDKAVFQCNASNSIGYDYSNGYINVLQDKPEFINAPQTLLIKAENTPVTINCQTFSAPKAIVSWTKDGFPINGGRYEIQDDGDLLISKLITADSGVYTCTAKNDFGSINGTSTLFVRQRTELMIRPIHTWVYFGQEVKFVCTGKTDRLETQNLRIVWSKDNSIIDFSINQRINVNPQDNSLIISGAQTTDTGIYTCNATNGLDYEASFASLVVQSKPNIPVNVKADCSKRAQEKLAIVTWSPGADNYAPVITNMVEYSTQYDRKTWYEIEVAFVNVAGTGDSIEVTVNMRPHIRYQFRVRAANRIGMSEPSDPTINDCFILPEIPTVNPSEVFAYGTLKNNLVIQWTPMPYIDHNGAKLGYEITVACINCATIPNNKANTSTVSDWDQNILTYYNFQLGATTYEMETFKQFKVSIRSKNEIGLSKTDPTVTNGYSGDDSPTAAPGPIEAGTLSRGVVPLTWPVILENQVLATVNGFFRGFRIEWCLSSLSVDECTASAIYQDIILQSLNLPVLFSNKRRKRSASDNEVDTNDKSPSIRVVPKYSSTAAHHEILSRRKRAALIRPDQWDFGKNLTTNLVMIPGNTPIKVWVRYLNTLYAGPMSAVVQLTTFEDTPGPVTNFRLLYLGINHVLVQWDMPFETNGVITGFRLGCREIKALELLYMTTYPDITDPTILKFEMSGLRAETNYRVLIWALTSQGQGVESFIDIVTQPANIAPNAPRFVVTSIFNSTVNVTFAPSDIGVKGSVFLLQYRKFGQYRWDESQPEYVNRWIFVQNLANDTDYEVRVVATNGAGMATPSDVGTFHTSGKLDPTRPAESNTIWFIIVILLIIIMILLIVFMLWYREKRMEHLIGGPVKTAQPLYNPEKVYTEDNQPLYPPSQMSGSIQSAIPPEQPGWISPPREESMSYSNATPSSGALIEDDQDLSPVSFEDKPARKKKHRSKKQKPVVEEGDEDNDDAII